MGQLGFFLDDFKVVFFYIDFVYLIFFINFSSLKPKKKLKKQILFVLD
jgi:hypothetical protein